MIPMAGRAARSTSTCQDRAGRQITSKVPGRECLQVGNDPGSCLSRIRVARVRGRMFGRLWFAHMSKKTIDQSFGSRKKRPGLLGIRGNFGHIARPS
jgi:hypothetical protein